MHRENQEEWGTYGYKKGIRLALLIPGTCILGLFLTHCQPVKCLSLITFVNELHTLCQFLCKYVKNSLKLFVGESQTTVEWNLFLCRTKMNPNFIKLRDLGVCLLKEINEKTDTCTRITDIFWCNFSASISKCSIRFYKPKILLQ